MHVLTFLCREATAATFMLRVPTRSHMSHKHTTSHISTLLLFVIQRLGVLDLMSASSDFPTIHSRSLGVDAGFVLLHTNFHPCMARGLLGSGRGERRDVLASRSDAPCEAFREDNNVPVLCYPSPPPQVLPPQQLVWDQVHCQTAVKLSRFLDRLLCCNNT